MRYLVAIFGSDILIFDWATDWLTDPLMWSASLSNLNWVPIANTALYLSYKAVWQHIWGEIQMLICWDPVNQRSPICDILDLIMLGFWFHQAKGGSELYLNQDTWNQEVINNGGAGRIVLALSFTAHLPLLQCGFFRKICIRLFFHPDCLRYFVQDSWSF